MGRTRVAGIIPMGDGFAFMHRVGVTKRKDYQEYYTFPGGGLEEGETPEEGTIREIKEELGINVKIVKKVDKSLLVQIAGILVVVGHTFPIFFEFKGGKGIATSLGVLLMINWKIGLICLVFALVIMAVSKMVSMGSVGAAILFPVLTIFIDTNFIVDANGIKYFIFSLLLALLVIFNHRENIKRIATGTENKLSFKNTKA